LVRTAPGKAPLSRFSKGFARATAGDVSVLGIDPAHDAQKLKSRIGVVLQQTAFPNKIRVVEIINLYGKLYKTTPDAKNLLERFALAEKANAFCGIFPAGKSRNWLSSSP
jgi:ABC-2 type transport system ATP-binding protein